MADLKLEIQIKTPDTKVFDDLKTKFGSTAKALRDAFRGTESVSFTNFKQLTTEIGKVVRGLIHINDRIKDLSKKSIEVKLRFAKDKTGESIEKIGERLANKLELGINRSVKSLAGLETAFEALRSKSYTTAINMVSDIDAITTSAKELRNVLSSIKGVNFRAIQGKLLRTVMAAEGTVSGDGAGVRNVLGQMMVQRAEKRRAAREGNMVGGVVGDDGGGGRVRGARGGGSVQGMPSKRAKGMAFIEGVNIGAQEAKLSESAEDIITGTERYKGVDTSHKYHRRGLMPRVNELKTNNEVQRYNTDIRYQELIDQAATKLAAEKGISVDDAKTQIIQERVEAAAQRKFGVKKTTALPNIENFRKRQSTVREGFLSRLPPDYFIEHEGRVLSPNQFEALKNREASREATTLKRQSKEKAIDEVAATYGISAEELKARAEYNKNYQYAQRLAKQGGYGKRSAVQAPQNRWFSDMSARFKQEWWVQMPMIFAGMNYAKGYYDDVISTASHSVEVENWYQKTLEAAAKSNKFDSTEWLNQFAAKSTFSRLQAKEMATTMYSNMTSAGMDKSKAFAWVQKMLPRAADIASVRDVPIEDVISKIQSGITGLPKPLKAYGIDVTIGAMRQYMKDKGVSGDWKELDLQTKQDMILNKIFEQSEFAHGDMVKTLKEYANQLRFNKARLEDFNVTMGQVLLPATKQLAASLGLAVAGVSQWYNSLSPGGQKAVAGTMLTGVGIPLIGAGAMYGGMYTQSFKNILGIDKWKPIMIGGQSPYSTWSPEIAAAGGGAGSVRKGGGLFVETSKIPGRIMGGALSFGMGYAGGQVLGQAMGAEQKDSNLASLFYGLASASATMLPGWFKLAAIVPLIAGLLIQFSDATKVAWQAFRTTGNVVTAFAAGISAIHGMLMKQFQLNLLAANPLVKEDEYKSIETKAKDTKIMSRKKSKITQISKEEYEKGKKEVGVGLYKYVHIPKMYGEKTDSYYKSAMTMQKLTEGQMKSQIKGEVEGLQKEREDALRKEQEDLQKQALAAPSPGEGGKGGDANKQEVDHTVQNIVKAANRSLSDLRKAFTKIWSNFDRFTGELLDSVNKLYAGTLESSGKFTNAFYNMYMRKTEQSYYTYGNNDLESMGFGMWGERGALYAQAALGVHGGMSSKIKAEAEWASTFANATPEVQALMERERLLKVNYMNAIAGELAPILDQGEVSDNIVKRIADKKERADDLFGTYEDQIQQQINALQENTQALNNLNGVLSAGGNFTEKLQVAYNQQTPYTWGGASLKGADCSGLGCLAMGKGHSIGTGTIEKWETTNINNLEEGDAVMLKKPSKASSGKHKNEYFGHVAWVGADGYVYEQSSSKGKTIKYPVSSLGKSVKYHKIYKNPHVNGTAPANTGSGNTTVTNARTGAVVDTSRSNPAAHALGSIASRFGLDIGSATTGDSIIDSNLGLSRDLVLSSTIDASNAENKLRMSTADVKARVAESKLDENMKAQYQLEVEKTIGNYYYGNEEAMYPSEQEKYESLDGQGIRHAERMKRERGLEMYIENEYKRGNRIRENLTVTDMSLRDLRNMYKENVGSVSIEQAQTRVELEQRQERLIKMGKLSDKQRAEAEKYLQDSRKSNRVEAIRNKWDGVSGWINNANSMASDVQKQDWGGAMATLGGVISTAGAPEVGGIVAAVGGLYSLFENIFGFGKKKKQPEQQPMKPIDVNVINPEDIAGSLLGITKHYRLASNNSNMTMDIINLASRAGIKR